MKLMIKDCTQTVDALGTPLNELLVTPYSDGELVAEYVDVTAIPATDEDDDNITISIIEMINIGLVTDAVYYQ